MGEVYDQRLDRDVAVKVLPEAVGTRPTASHISSAAPGG